ncbi:MAG: hypothetical protein QOD27_1239 [Microbacteriaceae bacterium]|jgi:L-ascorbate metabolism protein UlaG (beta-lactamase superfamily)|nr:hypothetical protein [Microbacteriaceae bacterium]MDQ1553016.1 hypothetical protein [Microbacteriaceae bacterium]
MRVNKLEHACLIIEDAGKTLIVDPGAFTTPVVGTNNVVGIVVTHEHGDHWTDDQLKRIIERNPDAQIFGPAGFAAAATGFDVTVVNGGDTQTVGPFTLRFFGEKHAVIHSSIPVIDNVGVMVNDTLYYPGDSFTIPEGVAVDTLAVPVGAPWLKISEVIDYVEAVKPRRSFPTHEMVLSVAGKQISNERVRVATENGGGEFFPLEPGQSIDL